MTIPSVSSTRPIGGFFALHEADGAAFHNSILGRWTARRPFAAFVNARSAFAALVDLLRPLQVWLPAYMCTTLIAVGWKEKVRFYPVGENLEPDIFWLDHEARAGDIVLAVDFFGVSVGAEFISFARRRHDLWFVDDRAHALDPARDFWAQWCLHSPRKLLGVADGGILVATGDENRIPQCYGEPDAIGLWTAPLLRYEDRSETHNDVWYSANQEKETATTASGKKMTKLSEWILSHTALDHLADRRRRNWHTLRKRLRRWIAFEREPDGAPFGFVIKVAAERRAELLKRLYSKRIFAAVHWSSLPSEAGIFPEEHDLCRRLITLPCDHRYDEAAMRWLGERVVEALS